MQIVIKAYQSSCVDINLSKSESRELRRPFEHFRGHVAPSADLRKRLLVLAGASVFAFEGQTEIGDAGSQIRFDQNVA